jgi:hypothetical protein
MSFGGRVFVPAHVQRSTASVLRRCGRGRWAGGWAGANLCRKWWSLRRRRSSSHVTAPSLFPSRSSKQCRRACRMGMPTITKTDNTHTRTHNTHTIHTQYTHNTHTQYTHKTHTKHTHNRLLRCGGGDIGVIRRDRPSTRSLASERLGRGDCPPAASAQRSSCSCRVGNAGEGGCGWLWSPEGEGRGRSLGVRFAPAPALSARWPAPLAR